MDATLQQLLQPGAPSKDLALALAVLGRKRQWRDALRLLQTVKGDVDLHHINHSEPYHLRSAHSIV